MPGSARVSRSRTPAVIDLGTTDGHGWTTFFAYVYVHVSGNTNISEPHIVDVDVVVDGSFKFRKDLLATALRSSLSSRGGQGRRRRSSGTLRFQVFQPRTLPLRFLPF